MLSSLSRCSLQRQMALILGAVGLFPLVLTAAVAIPYARSSAEERAGEQISREGRRIGAGLALLMDEIVRDVQRVAEQPELGSAAADSLSPVLELSLERHQPRLRALEVLAEDGHVIAIAHRDGELRPAAAQASDERVPGSVRIAALRPSASGWALEIHATIGSSPRTLVTQWSADLLFRSVSQQSGTLDLAGFAHPSGRLISVHPTVCETRVDSRLRSEWKDAVGQPWPGTLVEGDTGDSLATLQPILLDDPAGGSMLAPFFLVISRSQDQIGAESAELEDAFLLAALGTSLMVVIASALFSRSLGRPLGALTRRVETFAVRMRSDHPARKPGDNNELHVLDEAFEDMADRVEEHQEELHRRNVELERVLKRLQRADQVKDELLSFLSHEMRTPLTAIRSFAELLRTTKDVSEDERQEFLSIIENECQRLELLSNDLLDLARIDLGEMPWRDQLIDPSQVIDDAARILRILAERAGAHLLLQVQPDLPKMRLDRDRMIQVLTNLVSNSLKYTPAAGQVTIRAERELDGDREWLRVSVIDTGPGIPMQSLESIFDPFVQAGDEARRKGGTGLGLTICARIVQHYGGTIHAENGAHGGAIMRVRVPAAPCTIGVNDAVLQ